VRTTEKYELRATISNIPYLYASCDDLTIKPSNAAGYEQSRYQVLFGPSDGHNWLIHSVRAR
jgi:hypothetical protein